MNLMDLYTNNKKEFLAQCTQCGACAKACPVLNHTDLAGMSAGVIQEAVYQALADGQPNDIAHTRAFSCMECFKCVDGVCPQGLNPMLVNEWLKGDFIGKGREKDLYNDSGAPDSLHRIVASIQVTGEEYGRLTTPSPESECHVVFFPGCNVYFQPEKILNALDIMDALPHPHAFIPGLDYCCGDNALFFGKQEAGSVQARALVEKIKGYGAKTLVLWCPTCHCRFEHYIKAVGELPFEVVSFPQYLSRYMDQLPLEQLPLDEGAAGAVTLHDPCKSVYTGVDPLGPRQVLSQLPGVELREMARHGKAAACCGSGAVCWFPEVAEQMMDDRLEEATATGADKLVTVCHYCNQVFASRAENHGLEVVSYVSLVAKALEKNMGRTIEKNIETDRTDRFKAYMRWKDEDQIMADARERIESSPFTRDQIMGAVQSVFL